MMMMVRFICIKIEFNLTCKLRTKNNNNFNIEDKKLLQQTCLYVVVTVVCYCKSN